MTLNIGDLVQDRSTQGVGVVVESVISNQGLVESKHVSHMIQVYPSVYYVLFPDTGRTGPYYADELVLQQAKDPM